MAEGIWRYQLEKDYSRLVPELSDVSFENQWLTLKDGRLTIPKNYAWDGCSPAYYVPVLGWLGTPDGALREDGKPQSYYASLVHDALCQFRKELPAIKGEQVVRLFVQMLLEGGFSPVRAKLYGLAVTYFGPGNWSGDLPADHPRLRKLRS